jgi:hypothetical protein
VDTALFLLGFCRTEHRILLLSEKEGVEYVLCTKMPDTSFYGSTWNSMGTPLVSKYRAGDTAISAVTWATGYLAQSLGQVDPNSPYSG